MHGWGLRGTLYPLYATGTRGGGTGSNPPPPQEPSPLKDHLHAKFHPDPSSRLDFYREQTDRHTHIALYVLDLWRKYEIFLTYHLAVTKRGLSLLKTWNQKYTSKAWSLISYYLYCSRRQWDGLIKAWKRRLHSWENPPSRESQSEPVSESETSFDWSQDVEMEKTREEGNDDDDDVGLKSADKEYEGRRSKFWSERKFFRTGDENTESNNWRLLISFFLLTNYSI